MHIRVLEHVRWLHKNVDLIPFSSSSSSYMWWQFQHIIKLSVPKLRVECNQVTSWARFNQWALGWILPSGMLAAPISTSLNPGPQDPSYMGNLFVACCSSLGVICLRLEYIMKQQHLPPVSWVLHFEAWASLKLVPTLLAFWTLEGDNSWQPMTTREHWLRQNSVQIVATFVWIWHLNSNCHLT